MERDVSSLEYLIKGKDYALKRLIISTVIAAPFWIIVVFWVSMLRFSIESLVLLAAAAGVLGYNIWCINHYIFYRIEIYPDGFFVRTNPFNAKLYKYGEIKSAEFKGKVLYNRVGKPSQTVYFLCFTESKGRKRRIYFEDTYCINEIKLIIERISE